MTYLVIDLFEGLN